MPENSFTDPDWKATLEQAGYSDFDSWWNAEQNLVETGNFRGPDANTSWSHVSRISLANGKTVYLKRQQNHFPNNILLKLRKIPTFEIEWKNYQRMQKAGVPTMKIVHFASRKTKGDQQCLIVSEELEGMSPLDEIIKAFNKHQWPAREIRLNMLDAIVKVIRKLHDAGLIHNALYGRHIYLNVQLSDDNIQFPDTYRACLIDLERTKSPGVGSPKLISHDLAKMYRRIPQWPSRDCLWFFKRYLGIKKLTPEAKEIVRTIAATRK